MATATANRYRPLSPEQRQKLGAKLLAMPPGPKQDEAVKLALSLYGPAPKIKAALNRRHFDPFKFKPEEYLAHFLHWHPWSGLDELRPGQLQIFNAIVHVIRQQIEKRDFENGLIKEEDLQFWQVGEIIKNWIRVESGNGIGKTKLLSGFVNWYLDCFNSIIYTFHTSAKQDQLTTWKEINRDRRGKDLPGRALDTKIDIDEEDRFAVSRTTSDALGKGEEKVKGQHHEFLGFVIDEADGVADYVFDGIETMESGGISVVLMTANPRSRSSRFHRIKRHSYVQTFRISSLYHPNVVQGKDVIPGAVRRDFIEKQIEKKCQVVDEHDEEKFTFELPYDIHVAGKSACRRNDLPTGRRIHVDGSGYRSSDVAG